MNFLLKGLRWLRNEHYIRSDVRIRNGIIDELGEDLKSIPLEQTLQFENHFLYPGLINAHDHLEMNLYPRLGNPPYNNYKEWGEDIYKPNRTPIREIEKVDLSDRLLWGGLKNLISGVTTVAHHNPWKKILADKDFPVRVMNNLGWSHSLAFGKNILSDFHKKPGNFVIHAAEGIDSLAFKEIRQLDRMGVLGSNTVLIHGIALSTSDIHLLTQRKCSVVWCPSSNEFLFGKTADIMAMKEKIPIALGSDSTLTGSAILLDEMRCAHDTGLATPSEIFEMVTRTPAHIFGIPNTGISRGGHADLIITPILHHDYFINLLMIGAAHIDAVFIDGQPAYVDEKISSPLKLKHAFTVNSVAKRSMLDVVSLRKKINKKVSSEILEANPLWNLLKC